jgi:hypothetical protein
MKFTTETETTRFTVKLSNGMRVTIADHGEDITIEVQENARDLLNGAPSGPDVPRYAPGGHYEFELPHVSVVGERCSEKDHDPSDFGFPAFGLATIENVRHYH